MMKKYMLPVIFFILIINFSCSNMISDTLDNMELNNMEPNVKIYYDANGADNGAVPTDSSEYLEGSSVSIPGNTGNLAKNDNIFYGWNTKADGSSTTYHSGDTFVMGGSDVTLYAFWINPVKIQSEDIGAGDIFGRSVSISGDYAIVGAQGEDTGGDRKSTRLNSSHIPLYRMPSSA